MKTINSVKKVSDKLRMENYSDDMSRATLEALARILGTAGSLELDNIGNLLIELSNDTDGRYELLDELENLGY